MNLRAFLSVVFKMAFSKFFSIIANVVFGTYSNRFIYSLHSLKCEILNSIVAVLAIFFPTNLSIQMHRLESKILYKCISNLNKSSTWKRKGESNTNISNTHTHSKRKKQDSTGMKNEIFFLLYKCMYICILYLLYLSILYYITSVIVTGSHDLIKIFKSEYLHILAVE